MSASLFAIRVVRYKDLNDSRGKTVGLYETEREARQAAARALGRRTLRGASCWSTTRGLTYQFGPRTDMNDGPLAEICFDGSEEVVS